MSTIKATMSLLASATCRRLHTIVLVLSAVLLARGTELTYLVDEERPPLTHLGSVFHDADLEKVVVPAQLSDLRFSFLTEGNPQASLLWINSTSGELRTAARIDRESICPRLPICEFKVQTVIQALLGAFFKIIHLKVIVKDINDSPPTFDLPIYTLQIAESESPGSSFRLPLATDQDASPENSAIEYSIRSKTAPFTLEAGNGTASDGVRIRLDVALDREEQGSYRLCVMAVDGGNPRLTGTLTVNIDVTDVNDNPPVFQQQQPYNLSVSDNIPVDSSVATVTAVDPDFGDNGLVVYSLPPSQEDTTVLKMFLVNGSTGEVTVKAALDSYAGRVYRLTIQARDSGHPQKTATTHLTIAVLDTHNSRPEILLNVLGLAGVAQVSELAEVGRAVAHVAVTDPDSPESPNGQISCHLDSTDQFHLQEMGGQQFTVILSQRLDREFLSHHSVTVTCVDSGTPPLNTTSSFTVEVGDENDNPPVFNMEDYTVEVTEGQANGDSSGSNIILTVHATDKDSGLNSQLSYRLAENSDSDFGMYTDGSILVTNPVGLDREDRIKGATRRLTILSVDGGRVSMTATAQVVVTIKDINDNPPRFSQPVYFFTVREDSPVGHFIGKVSAVDADSESNGIICFQIHHRNINIIPFRISPEGSLTLGNASLDRERTASYEFLVIAYDIGEPAPLSSSVVVRVKIADVNDNTPEFLFPVPDNYSVRIPHTLSKGAVIATLLATDLDEGKNADIVYTVECVKGSQNFAVEPRSGQIVLSRPLIEKDMGLHVLTVTAYNPVEHVYNPAGYIRNPVEHIRNHTGIAHNPVGHIHNPVGHIHNPNENSHNPFGHSHNPTRNAHNPVGNVLNRDRNAHNPIKNIQNTTATLHIIVCEGNITLTPQTAAPGGARNLLVVVTLVVTTAVMAVAVLLMILLLRFVDKDKEKKFYSTRLEEAKLGEKLRAVDLYPPADQGMFTVASGVTTGGGGGERKRKGVSFCLDDESQNRETSLCHEDAESEASGDASTSDSGKGGSDVDLRNNLGQVTQAGEASLQNQHTLKSHKNLSFVNKSENIIRCHRSSSAAPSASFEKMLPDLTPLDGKTPSLAWPCPSYYLVQSHRLPDINKESRRDNGFYMNSDLHNTDIGLRLSVGRVPCKKENGNGRSSNCNRCNS